LAATHRRKIGDLDLVYGQGRLIIRNFGERFLCILCVRNLNVPLLNLTVNVAAKKLSEMVFESKGPEIDETRIGDALDARSQFLNTEVLSIISAARVRGVILQATGDAAIRLHCPSASRIGSQLDNQLLQLAGSNKQNAQINQVLETMGYSRQRGLSVLRGSQGLRFTHPQKQVTLEIFLDALKAHTQLDFSQLLSLYDNTLPLADLLLWKILHTPFDEKAMRIIVALINDHPLGGPGEAEKIDTSRLIGLCSGDWGWYKIVTENLEKTIAWAEKDAGEGVAVFLERARQLHQLIKDAPKSEGWRLRGMFNEDTQL